jgi:hypothetical protein
VRPAGDDPDACEVARLFGLSDRWLAEGILRLVRELRGALVGPGASPLSDEPPALLLWHVAPELARRLGAGRLQANEAARSDVREARAADLRVALGAALAHDVAGLGRGKDPASARAATLLGRPAELGNPLAIAVDRIAPPAMPVDDPDGDRIAFRVLRRARYLDLPDTASWVPAMLPGANDATGVVLRPRFGRLPDGEDTGC